MNEPLLGEISAIVGGGRVFQGGTALLPYFREPPPEIALTLVKPVEHEKLGYAAGLAYDNDVPMYTHRRGFLPPEVAGSGGILFDLSDMNGIRRIDERNLLAFIEYGVTFERMKEELDSRNMRLLMPAAATSPSVVRSYVDRDVILANGATRPYQLTIFHAILPDGRVWMSGQDQLTPDGHSEFREDIGPMYSYFFHASEDIFGMPYAAKVFIYRRWEERRVTAYGFTGPEEAVEAAYDASRADQVLECVVADSRYASVLLAGDVDGAEKLADELSNWNLFLGFDNHRELVDVWDRQTAQIAEKHGGKRLPEEMAKRMEEKFEWPWYLRDRDYYRGSTQIIDYYTFTGKVPGLFRQAADSMGGAELGHVAIPSYFGGAFYCETDIYSGGIDRKQRERWVDAYRGLLKSGAHVSRPREEVAEIVYGKMNSENTEMIRNLKRVMDPKGLLNSDQLIEGV